MAIAVGKLGKNSLKVIIDTFKGFRVPPVLTVITGNPKVNGVFFVVEGLNFFSANSLRRSITRSYFQTASMFTGPWYFHFARQFTNSDCDSSFSVGILFDNRFRSMPASANSIEVGPAAAQAHAYEF